MAHRNIPVFVPHMGCPHQCVFCNQHTISGCEEFSPEDMKETVEAALSTMDPHDRVEIAFFGGSFTGIERGLMIKLLDRAQTYVNSGRVASIRLSTRPDYIDEEIITLLSRYSVKTVELGLQSFSDKVLEASHRGHTAHTSEQACRMLLDAGFSVVGQMMIGLPASTLHEELETAQRIIDLGIKTVRIYPTVVFYGTPLAALSQSGAYTPLTLEDAVERSAAVLRLFVGDGVECIRLGLCATESLTDPACAMAGPNHPALGELVWNAYYYTKLKNILRSSGLEGTDTELHLPPSLVSKAVGQKKQNILRLERETGTAVKRIKQDNRLRQPLFLPYRT